MNLYKKIKIKCPFCSFENKIANNGDDGITICKNCESIITILYKEEKWKK